MIALLLTILGAVVVLVGVWWLATGGIVAGIIAIVVGLIILSARPVYGRL